MGRIVGSELLSVRTISPVYSDVRHAFDRKHRLAVGFLYMKTEYEGLLVDSRLRNRYHLGIVVLLAVSGLYCDFGCSGFGVRVGGRGEFESFVCLFYLQPSVIVAGNRILPVEICLDFHFSGIVGERCHRNGEDGRRDVRGPVLEYVDGFGNKFFTCSGLDCETYIPVGIFLVLIGADFDGVAFSGDEHPFTSGSLECPVRVCRRYIE